MRDNYAAFVVDKAVGVVASHADVLRFVTRSSWGGTRDKPKNVCVGGYWCSCLLNFVATASTVSSVQLVGSRGGGKNSGAKKGEKEAWYNKPSCAALVSHIIPYPIFRVARQLSEHPEEASLSSGPVGVL